MNAQQLKASLLQYAIEGKLIKQNSNDESAEILLQKISEEKKRLTNRNVNVSLTGEEMLFDIPGNWKWTQLGNIVQVKGGKRVPLGYKLSESETPYIYLRVADMKDNTISFENLKYVEEEVFQKIKNYTIDSRDLYLTIAGTIGKVGFIPKELDGALLTENAVKLTPYLIDLDYLNILLNSPLVQDQFKSLVNKVAQPKLSIRSINSILVPLPPIEEQKRIARKVRLLEKKAEVYDKLHNLKENSQKKFPFDLEKSIIQYAMQGKIVSQDLSAEPAKLLLEKVKKDREKLEERKVIKKESKFDVITERESPFEIPKSWEWVRIKDICIINPKNKISDDFNVGFIPMKLIQDGLVNRHGYEIKKWKEIKKGYTHFQTDDIVIAKITPCFENRKSTIISNLPNNVGAGTTELFVLRPVSKLILKEYLLWIFKSHHFISNGVQSFSGTAGHQRVSKTYLENYLIPLPPFEEQERIVKEIEKVLEATSTLSLMD